MPVRKQGGKPRTTNSNLKNIRNIARHVDALSLSLSLLLVRSLGMPAIIYAYTFMGRGSLGTRSAVTVVITVNFIIWNNCLRVPHVSAPRYALTPSVDRIYDKLTMFDLYSKMWDKLMWQWAHIFIRVSSFLSF